MAVSRFKFDTNQMGSKNFIPNQNKQFQAFNHLVSVSDPDKKKSFTNLEIEQSNLISRHIFNKLPSVIESSVMDSCSKLNFPFEHLDNSSYSVLLNMIASASGRARCPVFCLSWIDKGNRFITGSSTGELNVWNGHNFQLEISFIAHESAVRCIDVSPNNEWIISADHNGFVKYWQPNLNLVKTIQAHTDPLRDISFAPTSSKFATCSDDATIKIWDFITSTTERCMRGHGADVKCIDWHPTKGLIASGSKDSQQPIKLWDPRTGASVSTIHLHKNTVMDLEWSPDGQRLASASRDKFVKVFDLVAMKELQSFIGHKKEVCAIAWHPFYKDLLATGGSDGCVFYWRTGYENEIGSIESAHDGVIWSLSYHPLGNYLLSGSNDHFCKIWASTKQLNVESENCKFNSIGKPLKINGSILFSKHVEKSLPYLEDVKPKILSPPITFKSERKIYQFRLPNYNYQVNLLDFEY